MGEVSPAFGPPFKGGISPPLTGADEADGAEAGAGEAGFGTVDGFTAAGVAADFTAGAGCASDFLGAAGVITAFGAVAASEALDADAAGFGAGVLAGTAVAAGLGSGAGGLTAAGGAEGFAEAGFAVVKNSTALVTWIGERTPIADLAGIPMDFRCSRMALLETPISLASSKARLDLGVDVLPSVSWSFGFRRCFRGL